MRSAVTVLACLALLLSLSVVESRVAHAQSTVDHDPRPTSAKPVVTPHHPVHHGGSGKSTPVVQPHGTTHAQKHPAKSKPPVAATPHSAPPATEPAPSVLTETGRARQDE